MRELFLTITAAILASGSIARAQNFNPHFRYSSTESLYTPAALIGRDDRQVRKLGDPEFMAVESSQGRIWCLWAGRKAARGVPSKAQLQNSYGVENATLFIDNDIILTNRHIFEDEKGIHRTHGSNCWFEHIQSGELIQASDDFAYPPLTGKTFARARHQDIAVIRLRKSISNATPIAESDLAIDYHPDNGTTLNVISNYATNFTPKDALTLTTCHSKTGVSLNNVLVSPVITDCDTGSGSSGSQVYVQKDGRPKLLGLVSGDNEEMKPGSEYDMLKHATWVTTFDDSLIESYKKVRARPATPVELSEAR